jgi:hypothetical protein
VRDYLRASGLVLGLLGTWLLAFGLRTKRDATVEKLALGDLYQKDRESVTGREQWFSTEDVSREVQRPDFRTVKANPWLFWAGLVLITLAVVLQALALSDP